MARFSSVLLSLAAILVVCSAYPLTADQTNYTGYPNANSYTYSTGLLAKCYGLVDLYFYDLTNITVDAPLTSNINGTNNTIVFNPCGPITPPECITEGGAEGFLIYDYDNSDIEELECVAITDSVLDNAGVYGASQIRYNDTTSSDSNFSDAGDKAMIEIQGIQLRVNTTYSYDENTNYTINLLLACDKDGEDYKFIDSIVDESKITIEANSTKACYVYSGYQLLYFFEEYKIEFSIVGAVVGLFICFLGLYLIKPTVFLLGAFLAGAPILAICFLLAPAHPENWLYLVFFGISLLIGLGVGFLLMKLEKIGFMAVGAILGYILGSFVQSAFLSSMDLPHPELIYIAVIVLLVAVCAVAAFFLHDHTMIISTAFSGAFFVLKSISLIFGGFPNGVEIAKQIEDHTANFDYTVYIYLGAIIVLFIAGAVIQYMHRSRRLRAKEEEKKGKLIETSY